MYELKFYSNYTQMDQTKLKLFNTPMCTVTYVENTNAKNDQSMKMVKRFGRDIQSFPYSPSYSITQSFAVRSFSPPLQKSCPT